MALPFLFNWATANTDPNAPPPQPTMTREEMRQWMNVLLRSDTDRMKDAIAELTREGATPAEREAALEELNTLCEVIDNANDLHTLGGLVPALEALKNRSSNGLLAAQDRSSGLRAKAACLIATCAHNNAKFQRQLLEFDPLPTLLELLSRDESSEVRAKSLTALSGILRNNPVACENFTRLNGWTTMARSYQGNDLNFHRKLTFILTQFLHSYPLIKELISDPQIIQHVLHLLEYSDPDLAEKALDLMLEVTGDSPMFAAKWREAGAAKALDALKGRVEGLSEEEKSGYDGPLEKVTQLQQIFSKL